MAQNEEDRVKEVLKAGKSPRVGWYCGNCKNWHGPHMDTCPKPPLHGSLRDRIKVENG